MSVSQKAAPTPAQLKTHWSIDPDVVFLNHGAFGACPAPVLQAQQRFRDRMERQTTQFFARDIEPLLDDAREPIANFLGADPQDIAPVANASDGVNAVLRSIDIRPGDELLTTSHEYNMCRCALDFVAKRNRAKLIIADIPFPLESQDQVYDAIMQRVTARTRLVVIDHVTSPTALIFPVQRLVRDLDARGVDTLVDAAHAPGLIDVDINSIGAAYYTANLHKWLSAPKTAAILHVRRDRQKNIHPTIISHGYDVPRTDRPRFHLEFDWRGTFDPTPFLAAPAAIEFLGALFPGGWSELRESNRAKALAARKQICDALNLELPAPDDMVAAMAAIPLPPARNPSGESVGHADPLQAKLLQRFNIEIPVIPWPAPGARVLRISAQVYNTPEDFHRLSDAVKQLIDEGH